MNKSDLKQVTSHLWVKILCASLIGVASLVMIILTILNLTNTTSASSTVAFQIIIGVVLILVGLVSAILTLVNDFKQFDAKAVIADGILVGAGIFVLLEEASAVLNVFIGFFIPAIIFGIGLFMVVKSIVDLAKKHNSTQLNVIFLIVAIILCIAGILLLIYAEKVIPYMWIILGIIILAYSITLLVKFIKESKKQE